MCNFILDCQPTTIKLINLCLFRIHHGGFLVFFFLSIIYLSHKKKQISLSILKYMSRPTITRMQIKEKQITLYFKIYISQSTVTCMQIKDFDHYSLRLKTTELFAKIKKFVLK